jgi:hypothetical protein
LEELDRIEDVRDDDTQNGEEVAIDASTVGTELASFDRRAKADGDRQEGDEGMAISYWK